MACTYYVDDERGVHRLSEFEDIIVPEIGITELQQLEQRILHSVSNVTLSFEDFIEFVKHNRR